MKQMHKVPTARLILAPIQMNDHPFILELLNTEGFIKFIGDRQVKSLAEAEQYVQKVITDPNINYWVVRSRDGGEAMGVVSLVKRDYLDFHDIGFAFLPQFFGFGYAEEAVRGFLNVILTKYASPEILANPMPANLASIKLLKKLGLRYIKTLLHEGEEMDLFSVRVEYLRQQQRQ